MSNAKNLATFLQSGGSIAGDANFDSNTLFVDASANAVGIGTNSPGTKMDIVAANNSQLRIDSSDTNDTTFLLDYNGGGATNRIRIRNAAGDLAFNVSNTTEAMRIDSSGNVGIGNTSAQTRLFVGDGSGTEGITIYSGTTGEGQLRFADGTSGSALYQGRIEYNHSTSKLLFGAGGTTPIAIDSNGNLGIGTISPQLNASYDRTIHVHSVLGSLIKLTDDTSGSGASDGTDLLNYGNDTYLVNRDVGDIIFNITGSNKMRIDSSGNVGIGETNPASYGSFVVTGTGAVGNFNASSGAALVQLYENGAGRFGIQTLNGSAGAKFTVAGSEKMRITSGGAVGIGTTSPSSLTTLSASGGGTILELNRSNTNTTGAVGTINFTASDGHSVANIYAIGDGNNEGAHLVFKTTSAAGEYNPYGSSTFERMRIRSDGGITFNGDTAAANALDDYEEGTFSPFSGIGSAFTGETTNNARYVKIGGVVHIDLRITWTGTDNSSNALTIPLPFTSTGQISTAHTGVVFYNGTQIKSGAAISSHVARNTAELTFYRTSGGSFDTVNRSEINGTYDWLVSFSYFTH